MTKLPLNTTVPIEVLLGVVNDLKKTRGNSEVLITDGYALRYTSNANEMIFARWGEQRPNKGTKIKVGFWVDFDEFAKWVEMYAHGGANELIIQGEGRGLTLMTETGSYKNLSAKLERDFNPNTPYRDKTGFFHLNKYRMKQVSTLLNTPGYDQFRCYHNMINFERKNGKPDTEKRGVGDIIASTTNGHMLQLIQWEETWRPQPTEDIGFPISFRAFRIMRTMFNEKRRKLSTSDRTWHDEDGIIVDRDEKERSVVELNHVPDSCRTQVTTEIRGDYKFPSETHLENRYPSDLFTGDVHLTLKEIRDMTGTLKKFLKGAKAMVRAHKNDKDAPDWQKQFGLAKTVCFSVNDGKLSITSVYGGREVFLEKKVKAPTGFMWLNGEYLLAVFKTLLQLDYKLGGYPLFSFIPNGRQRPYRLGCAKPLRIWGGLLEGAFYRGWIMNTLDNTHD